MKKYYVEVEDTRKYIIPVECSDDLEAVRQAAFEFSVMSLVEKGKVVEHSFKCINVTECKVVD